MKPRFHNYVLAYTTEITVAICALLGLGHMSTVLFSQEFQIGNIETLFWTALALIAAAGNGMLVGLFFV